MKDALLLTKSRTIRQLNQWINVNGLTIQLQFFFFLYLISEGSKSESCHDQFRLRAAMRFIAFIYT